MQVAKSRTLAALALFARAFTKAKVRVRPKLAPRPAVTVVSDYGVAATFPGLR